MGLDLRHHEGSERAERGGGEGEAGIINVAKSGGDYDTIAAGLAVADPGDVVVVFPGDYAENVTVPTGVRLMGSHIALVTRITGADTTGTRVTFEGSGTIRNMTMVGPRPRWPQP